MFRQSIDPKGGFPPTASKGGSKAKSGKKRKKVGKLKKRKRTKDPFSRERKAEQAFRFGERRYGQSGRSVYNPADFIRFHQSAQFNQARDTAEAKRGGGTFTGTSIGEEKRVREAQEADREFKRQEAETKSRFATALETLVDRTAPRTGGRSTGDFDSLLRPTTGVDSPIIVKDKPKTTPPELTDKQRSQVRRRAIEKGKKPETTIEEIETISLSKPTEQAPEPLPLTSGTQQRTGEELQALAIKTREQKLGYREGRVPEDRLSRQVSQADKDADAQKAKDRRRGFVGSGTSGGGSALLRPRPSPNNPSQSIFALQRQDSGTTIEGRSILRPEAEPSPFQQPQVGLQKQISGLDLSAEPEEPVEEEDIPDLKDEPFATTTDSPTTAINKVRDDLRKIVQEPTPEPEEEKFQAKAFPKPERTLLASPTLTATPEPQPEPQPKPKKKKPKKPKPQPQVPSPTPEPEPERIEEIPEPEPKPQPKATDKPKQESLVPTTGEEDAPLVETSAYGELLEEEGIFAEGSNKEGWLPTKYVIHDPEGIIGQKEPDYYYYVMSARGKSFGIVDIENEDLQGWNSIAKTRFDKLLKDGKIIFQ